MSLFLPRRAALAREQGTSMKSRVNREVHARFCEGLGVKFPGATRPPGIRFSIGKPADASLLLSDSSLNFSKTEPLFSDRSRVRIPRCLWRNVQSCWLSRHSFLESCSRLVRALHRGFSSA